MRKVFLLLALLALPLSVLRAQETPSVTVTDQVSLNGMVVVESVYSEGPGFIVIHTDNGEGAPGPVIGYRAVNAGMNNNVSVMIDTAQAAPMLFAMLHADTGEVGVYEFGTVEGADGPVRVNDQVITPSFNVAIIRAYDQPVSDDGMVMASSVTVAEPGWLVIHSDNNGAPGPVLGQTQLEAGTTTDVMVELAEEGRTDTLWPMLHVDTGEAGVYEFGTVEGADGPVVIDGTVAVTPFTTLPSVRMTDQLALNADNMSEMGMMAGGSLVAESVVSEGPGFLVIHLDNNGAPGPVAGFAPVSDGLNLNVEIMLDEGVELTPVVWPMLHVDTGEVGTYEFGTVEGADGPVRVNDQVLTFPINIAPSMTYEDQALEDHGEGMHIHLDAVVMDAPGWLALHSNNEGAPGPVLATAPLLAGVNTDVMLMVTPEDAGEQVFPMLHYDTCEAGVYEFGTVEGCDGPVVVGGNVVVSPLAVLAGE